MCDLNARTNDNQTALHLAVYQGHCKIVERLVGYGVELSVQDENGDTPLHLALARESVEALSADTPQLKKVCVFVKVFSNLCVYRKSGNFCRHGLFTHN